MWNICYCGVTTVLQSIATIPVFGRNGYLITGVVGPRTTLRSPIHRTGKPETCQLALVEGYKRLPTCARNQFNVASWVHKGQPWERKITVVPRPSSHLTRKQTRPASRIRMFGFVAK
ncbi:hypothetical protein SCLCIDRAFT_716171 [Scleroderma citrinum Foug A]|uniref:Uncharacterized protein n=1 Tax=Scleroderma citrinum Foug A TaxID=1036808 RepID=A0A0C3EPA2_9AGAM|nr:hypothetical protein SCLCIDRAFT_716171 [Scleroderma citrinum Foug A]